LQLQGKENSDTSSSFQVEHPWQNTETCASKWYVTWQLIFSCLVLFLYVQWLHYSCVFIHVVISLYPVAWLVLEMEQDKLQKLNSNKMCRNEVLLGIREEFLWSGRIYGFWLCFSLSFFISLRLSKI
jgi:hypothetical protein